jgi:Heavy metal associated domain 2
MSHYVHSIPGRLRVRSAAFRNHPENAKTARSLLGDLEGIRSVDANLITGSLLIRYDDQVVNSTQVLSTLVAEGWIKQLPSPKPAPRAAAPKIAGRWRRVADSLSEALPDMIADLIADKLAQRAAVALVRAVI